MTKQELVTRIERGRGEYLSALADIPDETLTQPNTVGIWSITDLLAHFIAHEQRALAELQAAQRGEAYAINHADNDAFNVNSIAHFHGQPFGKVVVAWLASTDSLIAAAEQLTVQEYDPNGPLCAIHGDTIDGALGNNTYGHYAEHLPEVQAWLRAYITLLRLPFQFLLSPIFLWGYMLAGGALNLTLLVAYLAFHLFLYAGGTALNSYYDRDEGPVGGLATSPPPKYLLEFSIAWQIIGFALALWVNPTVAAIYFIMFWMSVAYSHPRIRLKGKPFGALLTIMLGQGILPFYAGWAASVGALMGGGEPWVILAAFSVTLITGGMYPLTQIYQLDADAERGDLTSARFLGVENSFRVAIAAIVVGGAGAVYIAATRFSWLETAGLALFLAVFIFAVLRWRARFYTRSVMQNFKTVMRLYAGVTLPFLVWILFHLVLQTIQ